MPRQKSLVTVIRDMVRREISDAISGLLGAGTGTKRRRRRRRGPGRPPGAKNKRRRGRPAAAPSA
jgi:hypothetical protein